MRLEDGVSVLVALFLLSGLLTTILTIAYRTLGREWHALTWAVAFGLGTLQWGINLVHTWVGGNRWLFLLVNLLCIIVAGLIAAGFLQRAGGRRHRWPMLTATLVAVAILFWQLARPDIGLARATPQLFRALMLVVAARVVALPGRPANPAERSAQVMLWLFALFSIGVAALALSLSARGGWFADMDRWMLLLGLPTVYAGTGLFIVLLIAADLGDRMSLLAASDPLTGALNRRGFEEAALRAIATAQRHGQPLSIAVADIDRFKAINDAHGHAVGDTVLCGFARKVGETVRRGDVFGRMGGEEFALLLVNSPGDAAAAVVDRLRIDLACQPLSDMPPVVVTTSFGVAALGGTDTLASLLERADRALYRSKQDGRNTVTFAPEGEAMYPVR